MARSRRWVGMHTQPSPRRESRLSHFAAAFWVADALILGLALFFAVVGGALLESTVFAVVLIVGAALLGIHGYIRHRSHEDSTLTADARRIRERRGF